jgi:hypothetical protein
MDYEALKTLIWEYEDHPGMMAIHYGCECGCGGDMYTEDSWDESIKKSDEAKTKLMELGITFENY